MQELPVVVDPVRSAGRLAAVRRSGLLDSAPEESFDRLTELTRELLGVTACMITVVDGERSWWKSHPGLPPLPGTPPETSVEDSFCRHVIALDDALVLDDSSADERTRDSPLTGQLGVRGYAGFPVRTPDGQVLGSFAALDTAPRAWSAADLRVLGTLAGVVSTEVALRESLRAAEVQRARAEVVARAGELLSAGLEQSAVLTAVGRLAVPALGDVSVVYQARRDGRVVPVSVRHRHPSRQALFAASETAAVLSTEDPSGPGRVAATGLSELVATADDGRRSADAPRPGTTGHGGEGLRDAMVALGAVSHLSVPLSVRGEPPLGVLTVVRTAGGDPYTEDDVRLVEAIAASVSPALDNARQFATQRDFAARLQEALLTPPPAPDHLNVVVRYAPAEQEAQIGGDWYDAFVQPDGSTMLVIGDVAGHDSSAAVVMGQLRGLIRAIGYDSDAGPAEVLARSDVAATGLRVDAYATVLVARIEQVPGDLTTRRLLWSNAGHPPPVLLDTAGEMTVLERRPSPMLGVAPGAARTDHELQLTDGETLLLYTDGLVERRHVSWEDSLDLLRAALAGAAQLPLDVLADRLLQRMRPEAGEDDVALIAVRPYDQTRPPPAPSGPATIPLTSVPRPGR
ncbi:GAF domain-containing SpoIIE family protein phosphatase [Goekera deserti]|uniref:GAF domain-containing SpoIIE family protein phosphatase n=1 Tax=Goekera deserti TaxID=2497753 RepID=UPI001390E0D7|nr:GAF domain-containing SpoIIE family protein phosphatase [Goekera deserti]